MDFIKLDEQLKEMVTTDTFAGTVIIAKNNEIIFQGAYGLADREAVIPHDINTKINLGSCNKSFTAIAICRLEQAGKLDFDDIADRYVPAIAKLSQGRITIRQLLTHRAGLGNYKGDAEFIKDMHDISTIAGILPYALRPLVAEPNEGFNYSNSGYIVLGAVIEAVSGMDYYEYISENIYKPSGMADSGCYPATDGTARAKGYTRATEFGPSKPGSEDLPLNENSKFLPLRGGSAGGGYSTAPDLIKYMRALKNDVLIKDTFDSISPAPGTDYGFAAMRYQNGAIGHTGGAHGINAYFGVHHESGYDVAVLANVDMGAMRGAMAVNRFIGIPSMATPRQGEPGKQMMRKP